MNGFENFSKKHDCLICIDSDGCAIDSMDVKHINCFGPCVVDEWQLQKNSKQILDEWNRLNLYSMTRGINRFLGLAKILRYVNDNITAIEDVASLENWVASADELSNMSIEKAAKESGSVCLLKAFSWSVAVNRSIQNLSESLIKPFDCVKEKIEKIHETCDVAIVSSANYEAVKNEWSKFGLLEHVDILLAQNAGSKKNCIEKLLSYGYEKNKVLMVGDAPGDLDAAKKNGVFFYPILVKHENKSWSDIDEAKNRLQENNFSVSYQKNLIDNFEKNLS